MFTLIFYLFFYLQRLTLYGTISVNGEPGKHGNYRAGGGSGGTIKVNASTLVGRGSFTSNGGSASTGTYNGVVIGKLLCLSKYSFSRTFYVH